MSYSSALSSWKSAAAGSSRINAASYRAPAFTPIGGSFSNSFGFAPRGALAIGRGPYSAALTSTRVPPESMSMGVPYSTRNPSQRTAAQPIRPVTKGDWIGSIDAAIMAGTGRPDFSGGWSQGGQVNLANAIPWVMERPQALASEFGDRTLGLKGKTPGGIDLNPLDWLGEGIKKFSEVTAPLFDAIPNWARDTQLSARAAVYRNLVAGNGYGGIGGGVQAAITGMDFGTMEKIDQYQQAVLKAADPHDQLDAQQKLAVIAESIDLPKSVKDAIARNPKITDGQINQLLDEAGRAFSYQPGLAGLAKNMLPAAAMYGAEWYLTAGLGSVANAGKLGAVGSAVVRPFTLAARGGTALAAAGLGATGVSTAADAIARVQGNQAAVDFIENSYKVHPISDIPSVQLMTSFAVNPGEAIGLLKKGIVRPLYGTTDIVVGKVVGRNLAQIFATQDPTLDILSRAFRQTPPWVQDHLIGADKPFETLGAAQSAVLNWATESVLRRLPPERQAALGVANAGDWEAMHKVLLERHGREIVDLLKREPDRVAQTIYDTSWAYHQYVGPFDPEVAAYNAGIYQRDMSKLAALRHQYDAVAGYKELVAPKDRQAIRDTLDRQYPNPTDQVPVRQINTWMADQPALRRMWQDLVPVDQHGTIASLPRSSVDTMLDRARQEWDAAMKRNPIGTSTGRQTVLLPNYSERDLAEALGTDVGTVHDFNEAAADSPRLRRFVEEKTSLTPEQAAALTPEEVWSRASDYIDQVSGPWVKLGEQVTAARKRVSALEREMANADVVGDGELRTRLEREYKGLLTILHDAGDPLTPYSQNLRGATRRARVARLVDQAEKRAGAVAKLDAYHALEDQASAMNLIDHSSLLDRVRPTRDGGYGWAGDAPIVSRAMYDRLVAYYQATGRDARGLAEMGDADLWGRIREAWDTRDPRFRRGMNSATKRYIESTTGLFGKGGSTLDDFAGAWSRQSGQEVGAEDFLGQVASLRRYRDEVLSGARLYDVKRTAADPLTRAARRTPEQMGKAPKAAREALASLKNLASEQPGWPSARAAAAEEVAKMSDAEVWQALMDSRRQGAWDRLVPRTLDDRLARALGDTHEPTREAVAADLAWNVDPEWEVHQHPQNVAELRNVLDGETPDASIVRSVLDADPLLRTRANDIARAKGTTLDQLIGTDPQALKAAVPDEVVPPVTALDDAILSGDPHTITDLVGEYGARDTVARDPKAPIPNVDISTAEALAKQVKRRLSNRMRRDLLDAGGDLTDAPNAAILRRPENKAARQVLSLLNHGIPDTDVATLDGLLALQHEIELGNATQMGIGLQLQADAQRLIRDLVGKATNEALAQGPTAGYLRSGMHPAIMAEDDLALAQRIINGEVDGVDMLYGPHPEDLSYGLKRRPKEAVALEFQNIPGLAEEFMNGHFAPFHERLGSARARQAFNLVFGGHSNSAIRAETYARFSQRAAQAGIDPLAAKAVWDGWRQFAEQSHNWLGIDYPLYARPGNIPTKTLNDVADKALAKFFGAHVDGVSGEITWPSGANRKAWEAVLSTDKRGVVDYARMMHESASIPMRALAQAGPLGRALETVYERATKNWFTTTGYYLFRFAGDFRFHAMNFVENYMLYGGKAALIPDALKFEKPLMGWTRENFTRLVREGINDTGYPAMRGRDAWAQRTFEAMQGQSLTKAMKGLQSEDPAIMEQALKEFAQYHPDMAAMLKDGGYTPETWVRAMDDWYTKLLTSAEGPEAAIDAAIWSHPEVVNTPALNEVWGRLAEVNKNLWGDVRETFFGNPDRTRIERVLNSYLLLWPLSYTIKAVKKWMLPLMFDNVGGLRTNALGAVALNDLIEAHNERLKHDPAYANWMEKNRNTLFLAQQLIPMTPDAGVSLSRPVRDLLFNRSLNIMEVGPVYSIKTVYPRVAGELYQDWRSVPGIGEIAGVTSQMAGNAPKKGQAPMGPDVSDLWSSH